MQSAREGQHKGHDVRADMVVEDLSKIRDGQRMIGHLRIVVAGCGSGLWRLQPAEPTRLPQQLARQPAERCLGIDDLAFRRRLIFRDDHANLGYRLSQALAPAARRFRLRRQHDELERVGT